MLDLRVSKLFALQVPSDRNKLVNLPISDYTPYEIGRVIPLP